MNKKMNTILFILGATFMNVLVAIISFFALFILYYKFAMHLIPEANQEWGIMMLIVAALAISFFVYRAVLRILIDKVDVEKYFDPLFVSKYKKRY